MAFSVDFFRRDPFFGKGAKPAAGGAQMDAWQCSAGRQYPPKAPLIRCEEAPALSVMRGVRGDAYS